MKPKFVSIAYEPEGDLDRIGGCLVALDDTGQIWYLWTNSQTDKTTWKKFPEYEYHTGPEPE